MAIMNRRFQKITRDSTAEDRRTFNGSANKIVLMALMWGRRKVHCRFGFASEGMKSGSGAPLHPHYPRLEIQQSGKPLHSRPNKHWRTKLAMIGIAHCENLHKQCCSGNRRPQRASWERRFDYERWRRRLLEVAQYLRFWRRIPAHLKT